MLEKLERENWWTVSGQLEKFQSDLVSNINSRVLRIIQMRNGLGEFLWLKDRFDDTKQEPLGVAEREKLNDEGIELYEHYKFFTSKGIDFVTDATENVVTYWDFAAHRTMECVNVYWDREKTKSELKDNPILKSVIDVTNQEQRSKQFEKVKAGLYEAVMPLLTSRMMK